MMAPHQGHRTDASSLPSRALPTDVSLHAAVSSALDETTLSASPPRIPEVPHLHMHKITTTDSINIYIIYIWTDISKDNINKKNKKCTSMVKNLPWRQHHVWVTLEVHPSIGVLKYYLRHLPPYPGRIC
jgi:hypothetical protein